jgi:hypothetical protein
MTRQILFRGLDKVFGQWRLGSYVRHSGAVEFISHPKQYPPGLQVETQIRPETVGQYTGFRDKNGEMIFEDDIVAINGGSASVTFQNGAWTLDNGLFLYECAPKVNVIGDLHRSGVRS